MELHHLAWLSAHLERSEAWLREQLADGFDVHHLDGDHGNNDPRNLVLIESADHLMRGPRRPPKRVLRAIETGKRQIADALRT